MYVQRADALGLYRKELERRIAGASPAANGGGSKTKIPPDVHPPEALQVHTCLFVLIGDGV